jgi:hypothetical protein
MKLPRPAERLAGCVWLPRILSKARRAQAGTLPPDYAANFCHPKGVDGLFLVHFELSRAEVLMAAAQPDASAAEWFLSRTSPERIEQWNQMAVNLGRPGYPFADRLPMGLATTYKHVAGCGLSTIFEVLEADEADAGHGAPPSSQAGVVPGNSAPSVGQPPGA